MSEAEAFTEAEQENVFNAEFEVSMRQRGIYVLIIVVAENGKLKNSDRYQMLCSISFGFLDSDFKCGPC